MMEEMPNGIVRFLARMFHRQLARSCGED